MGCCCGQHPTCNTWGAATRCGCRSAVERRLRLCAPKNEIPGRACAGTKPSGAPAAAEAAVTQAANHRPRIYAKEALLSDSSLSTTMGCCTLNTLDASALTHLRDRKTSALSPDVFNTQEASLYTNLNLSRRHSVYSPERVPLRDRKLIQCPLRICLLLHAIQSSRLLQVVPLHAFPSKIPARCGRTLCVWQITKILASSQPACTQRAAKMIRVVDVAPDVVFYCAAVHAFLWLRTVEGWARRGIRSSARVAMAAPVAPTSPKYTLISNNERVACALSSEDLLKTFPRGPYTTARTHQRNSVFEFEFHNSRIAESTSLMVAAGSLPRPVDLARLTDPTSLRSEYLSNIRAAVEHFGKENPDGEMKLTTLLNVDESDGSHELLVHVQPLGIRPDKPVTVPRPA